MNAALALLQALFAATLAVTPVNGPIPKVGSGKIVHVDSFPAAHVPRRALDIWVPADYPAAAPYAVLYMHDGQMLFDADLTWNHQEWRADEVAGKLSAGGKVRPFIIVGIANGGAARHSEYFPQQPFESLTPAQQEAQYAQFRDGGQALYSGKVYSDRYLEFLVSELKPYIDRRFRVSPRREDTFVLGSSMGGLISLYALARYPQVFGGAACLSTHWPGDLAPEPGPAAAARLAWFGRNLPPAGSHRIYFDHGTGTLDARYPALQRQVDAFMRAKGYTAADWQTRVFPGAIHDEAAWAARLDVPLGFLFDRP